MERNDRQPNYAAELLARGRSPRLYEQFKAFQRGEEYFDDRYRYSEISGFLASGALVQMWRNQSAQHSHLLMVGDLRTGSIDYAPLENVRELSRHQLAFQGHAEEWDRDIDPPSALLRDFSVLYGEARLNGEVYDLHASADRIHLTDKKNCVRERVGDYVELDRDIYHVRKQMAEIALKAA